MFEKGSSQSGKASKFVDIAPPIHRNTMQFKTTQLLTLASAVSIVASEEINSSSWTTLTATATFKDAKTDYASTFGIAIEPITTGSLAPSSTSIAKRDAVSQIADGQLQATTKTASSQAAKKTAPAVSQIGDGQVQATTKTTLSQATKKTAPAVSQISDGQVQGTTKTLKPTDTAVSQIGDGQVQASTKASTAATGASQISDGQVQATTKESTAASAASQLSDGQAQATDSADSDIQLSACSSDSTLSITLKNGILYDAKGRVGAIVANRQFQFDGPPPQAGTIYAKGWSITSDGNLAIGDSDVFYKCLSGDFYNLYDESIGGQCSAIHLNVVGLIDC